MNRILTFLVSSLLFLLAGCTNADQEPPGWRDPVYQLLLTEKSFPPEWDMGFSLSENVKSPETNHVAMEWLGPNGEGLVIESIWRSYTNEDAKSKFDELKVSRYSPSRTLTPEIKYIPFSPPPELTYRSIKADRFYIACGWLNRAYCVTIAQYRNYTVALRADLRSSDNDKGQSKGLSYYEIEGLIKDMDAIFISFLRLD